MRMHLSIKNHFFFLLLVCSVSHTAEASEKIGVFNQDVILSDITQDWQHLQTLKPSLQSLIPSTVAGAAAQFLSSHTNLPLPTAQNTSLAAIQSWLKTLPKRLTQIGTNFLAYAVIYKILTSTTQYANDFISSNRLQSSSPFIAFLRDWKTKYRVETDSRLHPLFDAITQAIEQHGTYILQDTLSLQAVLNELATLYHTHNPIPPADREEDVAYDRQLPIYKPKSLSPVISYIAHFVAAGFGGALIDSYKDKQLNLPLIGYSTIGGGMLALNRFIQFSSKARIKERMEVLIEYWPHFRRNCVPAIQVLFDGLYAQWLFHNKKHTLSPDQSIRYAGLITLLTQAKQVDKTTFAQSILHLGHNESHLSRLWHANTLYANLASLFAGLACVGIWHQGTKSFLAGYLTTLIPTLAYRMITRTFDEKAQQQELIKHIITRWPLYKPYMPEQLHRFFDNLYKTDQAHEAPGDYSAHDIEQLAKQINVLLSQTPDTSPQTPHENT